MESADGDGGAIGESETSTPVEMQLAVAGIVYARGFIVNECNPAFLLPSLSEHVLLFRALSRPNINSPKHGDTDVKAQLFMLNILGIGHFIVLVGWLRCGELD